MPHKRKDLAMSGPTLWYLVGLIATDGCLSSDGRHIDITSKEYEFLGKIRSATGLSTRVTAKYGAKKNQAFHIQIGRKTFYNFLLLTGLAPRKSLTIRPLHVPRKYFVDFFRGVIDGDGCLRRWVHPSNGGEQWSLRIYSGSGVFIKWLYYSVGCLLNVLGRVHKERDRKWVLIFGKMAAKEIARKCYYENCLGLERKIKIARECVQTRSGWSKSKTVLCQAV